jgi:ActR/RegA family two-component response regulator
MPRLHLFEFEDQQWFPTFLRNYITDFLQFLANATQLYKPVVPLIEKALKTRNTPTIVDLGSGGGGGLLWLNRELKKSVPDLKIVLTDFYPNISAFEFTRSKAANFEFVAKPIDARDVPAGLAGLRTQFLSFHHFKPSDAQRILQNAVNSSSSIAIFEGQERSLAGVLVMLLSPAAVWLLTPFIRPFKLKRLIFTYIVPVIPLVVLWDGIVSALRTYSVQEMNDLVARLDANDEYQWEIKRIKSGAGVILYLWGNKAPSK